VNDTVLVVPSIRANCLDDFINAWTREHVDLDTRVDLILVEDNPNRTPEMQKSFARWRSRGFHVSWEQIDEVMKGQLWIIPRRSDCVRSFGYLMAKHHGYEHVMTLDDDCYPNRVFEQLDLVHKRYLTGEVHSRWFNTLNSGKPRGIPFKNHGKKPVMVNHGIWTKVLDYDAPTQLVDEFDERFSFDSKIVPEGQYFPFCGMNAAWNNEATVLMYHLLMGKIVRAMDQQYFNAKPEVYSSFSGAELELDRLPFDRFGDIWCGLLMKAACDYLGWSVASGRPYIDHQRASDPFVNLRKEANGLQVNETLWELVDTLLSKPDQTRPLSAEQVYKLMGHGISHEGQKRYPEHAQYFKDLGSAMVVWANLCENTHQLDWAPASATWNGK
jgi:reversibly glycosylated polypeptide/UDP-arabinopyranose mutase